MNNNIFTFHKTVIGYRHIQEEIPCEDSSVSYTADDGSFQIIAIGDGHGDPACYRSSQGSKFVVAIAQKCLTDFAQAICSGDMDISSLRQRKECVEQLTNTIISKWNGSIRNDLLENKISEDDLRQAGPYENVYREGRRLEHLYGTTLIAALKVSKYLILIQQGDGRCDVFYDDGSVDQPIPWDDRCKGSTTTSMCDEDVFESIRSVVIDTEERGVVACYIGSDGVEDSYYENEETQLGTHSFYMDLSCKIHELDADSVADYLENFLPEFSKTGSADDISVAGIVNLDMIAGLIDNYKQAVEQYNYNESLNKKLEEAHGKLISMTRKHGVLEQHVADAESALSQAEKGRKILYYKLNDLISKRDDVSQKANTAEAELEEYQRECQEAKNLVEGKKYKHKRIISAIQLFVREIKTGFSEKETVYKQMLEAVSQYNTQIKKLEEALYEQDAVIESLKIKVDKAKTEFGEYDEKYREVEAERQKVQDEMRKFSPKGDQS